MLGWISWTSDFGTHSLFVIKEAAHSTISFSDSSLRVHVFRVDISDEYPVTPPIVSCDFPEEMELQWSAGGTLELVMDQVKQVDIAPLGKAASNVCVCENKKS